MVFLVLSSRGFEVLRKLGYQSPMWLNSEVLSNSEIEGLRKDGYLLTNFKNWIDPNDQNAISTAIDTIKQHHPSEVVWVEQ